MSIKAISWAWQQEAKSSHKFVLLAIADSANDFGEAQLSQSYLAWKTELSERVVRDALRALEEAELMSRLRTVRRDGTRGVDNVVLHLERGSEKAAWFVACLWLAAGFLASVRFRRWRCPRATSPISM